MSAKKGRKTIEKQWSDVGRDEQGRFTKGHANGFKPGTSGNPGGTVKGATFLSEAYKRLGAMPLKEFEAYQPKNAIEKIAFETLRQGMSDPDKRISAVKEIADRTEGKPRQAIDIDMAVTDWRELARRHGLSESDVIREARQLIESAVNAGDS